jgi:1-deoxy-D-xylulose-5-phosphate reductoisomerase
MKKKIAILGSTGSIGTTLIDILSKDKKNFEVIFLSAEKNYKKLYKQAKLLNVKNLIITNKKAFFLLLKLNRSKKIKIYNNFESLKKIISFKVDYCMCAISGLSGLRPTYEMVKYSKVLAIANKESIICGWNLIEKEIKKNKTKFIPVDSEHFSIWYGLNNIKNKKINSIYLTASGGPLFNVPLKNFRNIKISQALKHPNWKMGKKISIDSSTMMNKVFEVIEARNIFNIPYNKIKILIHEKSYVHALIKFNNGLIKIIAHDTNMKIPIFNTLYFNSDKKINTSKIDINSLSNLNFRKVDNRRFPLVNLIKKLPNKSSLFETALVSANDELVDMYLKKKIKYTDINKKLFKFLNKKEFIKLRQIQPKIIDEIIELNQYVRLNINPLSVYK